MKKLYRTLFMAITLATLLSFINCCPDPDPVKDKSLFQLLTEKQGGWSASTVTVPENTATRDYDWASFNVVFTDGYMTTSGYPEIAENVWPAGTFELSEDGSGITREDGVIMQVINLTETELHVSFIIPEELDIFVNGRTMIMGTYDFIFN